MPKAIDKPTPPTAAATAAAALEDWLQDHVRDTAISRDTAAYNRIASALGEIRAALNTVKE